jgi:transcriptional regulator with XRE-family HTH domain
MNFAQRLKEIREEKNLSQEQLGKEIDRSRTSISGYETYDRLPDVDTLIKLVKYFDISLDWLMGFSNVRRATNSVESVEAIYKDILDNLKEKLIADGIIMKDEGLSPEILRLSLDYGINAAIEILKLNKIK